jgi:squalene synthase HpnC
MVRKGGLEPPWASPLEPKSSASTNSATFAAAFAKRSSIAELGPVRQKNALVGPLVPRGNVVLSARCARFLVSAAHYENFPVASLLVPPLLRPAILAVYRFARTADDFADEGDVAPEERLAALDGFDAALDAIAAGNPPRASPFPELAAAITRHRMPLAPFRDLLSAFRQDVTTTRYATDKELFDYCRRSANPIGRLVLRIFDADAPENLVASDAICTALQLINFWQDIAADWLKGRIYLPAEDLVRFGVTEAHIAEARCDEAWRALMAVESARARALLESGRPLTRALPWRLRLEVSGVLAGGHRILDGIDATGGDVFRRRPKLSGSDWAGVACSAIFPPRRHRTA